MTSGSHGCLHHSMAGESDCYASEQGPSGVFCQDPGEVVEAPMTSREKCISYPCSLSHVSVFLGWAPLQKNAQLSNDMLREMMEMCCLWQWIAPSLKRMLGAGPGYDKIVEAWKMGILDRMKLFRLQLRLTCDGHAFWGSQVKDRPLSLRFLLRQSVCEPFRPVCYG